MQTISKQAKDFYTLVAMLKCAECIKFSLSADKQVGGKLKHLLNNLFNSFKVMMREATFHMPEENRKIWDADWSRDYLVFMSVFEQMSDMTDEQRLAVEEFSKQLIGGNVQIVNQEK